MRILVLDTSITFGGGQESLLRLAEGLREKGAELLFLVPEGAGLQVRLEAAGFPFRPWSPASRERMAGTFGPSEVAALLKGAREVRREAGLFRPDLVHANTERAALASALAVPPLPVPFVFHDRTLEARRGLVRWIGRRSRAVVAVSKAVAGKHGGARPGRVRVIPDGIDLARFSPLPLRAEGEDGVFAFAGRTSWEKGPHVFVRAALEALRNGVRARFVLCGDSPVRGRSAVDDEILDALDRESSSGRIVHVGFREDMPSFLAGVDVLVVPSLREGLGLAAIEALARGRPVIASRVGGLPEIVVPGENGILVDAGDARAIARAVAEIAAGRLPLASLAKGAARSVSAYSVERMIESVRALYEEIVDSPPSP